MPVDVSCPGCGLKLKAPDAMAGKKVKCKKCEALFRVPGPQGDSVGDSQALGLPAPPLPDEVPMAGAAEPAAVPVAKPGFGSAKPATAPSAAPAKPGFGSAKPTAAAPQPAAPPPAAPAPTPAAPPAKQPAAPPAAKQPAAKSPAAKPAPLPLDDDFPMGAGEDAPRDQGSSFDPFSFSDEPAPPAQKGKKGQSKDEEDEKPKGKRRDDEDGDKTRKAKKDEAGDEQEDQTPRYVRPQDQKSSKLPLVALVAGLATIGLVVFAVMTHNERKRKAAELENQKTTEKKPEEPEPKDAKQPEPKVVVPVPPKKDPPKPADPPKDPMPKDKTPKDPVPKDPVPKKPVTIDPPMPKPEPTGVALALPATMKPFALSAPNPKPRPEEKPGPNVVAVDVAVDQVKMLFTPALKDQDIVVVWESNKGFNGKGQQFTVDIFSPLGSKAGRFVYDGEGKEAKCDVSPDGKRFAAVGPDGKVTVWTLTDKTKVLDRFDPYADAAMAEHKKAGPAAVFLTPNANHVLVVSTAGAAHLFEVDGSKRVAEFVPAGTLTANRVALGKNLAADETRTSVVLAVGEAIYQVNTAALATAQKIDVGGEVGRSFGIGVLGVPGRVAFAFETRAVAPAVPEKAVLLCLPNDKPAYFKLPAAVGETTGTGWAGVKTAVIPTDKGVVYVEAEGKKFTPVGFAQMTAKARHVANDNGHWYLMPHPTDGGRSQLLVLGTDALTDLATAAEDKDALTVRLDDKGISR